VEKPYFSNTPLRNPISNYLFPTKWTEIIGEILEALNETVTDHRA
jgi:hypothetical protein